MPHPISYDRQAMTSIIGHSKPMAKVREMIGKFGPTQISVLISGENGTGKELVARALHENSLCSAGPFIAQNCAALQDTLIETELFGHRRGSFSGAVSDRKGLFEAADGGTIFLDEIGEMSLSAQAKILRVLQEREFRRVGGSNSKKLNIRVISATNRSLEELAEGSQFRPDLFHRLKGALIRIPRLSERREDIPLLAAHFLRKYSIEDARQNVRISNEALAELMSYSFPGNIRELENAIRYALVLSRGEWIKVDNLPEELRRGSEFRPVFSVGKVRHNELIKALKAVRLSSSDGSMKEWHEAMKSIKIEDICRFLLESEGGEFSRQEFASYLSRSGRNDRNKGATAGRYLQVMRSNGILEHNGGKAGKARYRLSEVFIISD